MGWLSGSRSKRVRRQAGDGKNRSDESGQAVVEYILMLLVAIGVVAVMANGFKRIILGLWQEMACDIAAPCPDCAPPGSVKNRLSSGSCKN